jgi:hypothetical protein
MENHAGLEMTVRHFERLVAILADERDLPGHWVEFAGTLRRLPRVNRCDRGRECGSFCSGIIRPRLRAIMLGVV